MSLEDILTQISGQLEHLTDILEEMVSGIDDREPAEVRPIRSTPAPETPQFTEPAGTSQKTIELINLAKELGEMYIYNAEKDQLVVDNRVLDEYNRRHLPTDQPRQ